MPDAPASESRFGWVQSSDPGRYVTYMISRPPPGGSPPRQPLPKPEAPRRHGVAADVDAGGVEDLVASITEVDDPQVPVRTPVEEEGLPELAGTGPWSPNVADVTAIRGEHTDLFRVAVEHVDPVEFVDGHVDDATKLVRATALQRPEPEGLVQTRRVVTPDAFRRTSNHHDAGCQRIDRSAPRDRVGSVARDEQ